MIQIQETAGDPRLLAGFLDLPKRVYQEDSRYVPTPRAEVLASLWRPEFAASQKMLVALSGEFPVARLVARVSPNLRDENGRPYGMIGFFEALAWYEEAVAELFREAARLAARRPARER